MAAGLNPTKTELDTVAGGICRDINTALDRAKRFKAYLDGKTDAELIALGYVQADVDNMRSAFADGNQLFTIFDGTATLGTAKDFKAFLRRLWGTGGVV